MNTIPMTATRLLSFFPPLLRSDPPSENDPEIRLKVPTGLEKDNLTSLMIHYGLEKTSNAYLRAVLIDDLYSLYDAAKADEMANVLDSFWQLQEVESEAMALWKEREIERMLDENYGAPPIDAEVRPPSLISPRHKAQVELYTHEMLAKSDRLRDLVKQQYQFEGKQKIFLVRLHVQSIRGIPEFASRPLEFDPDDQLMTLESAERLRNHLHDDDWADLSAEINGLYGLSRSEEKNSDSLPERQHDQIGSPEPSVGSESSDGSLTESSIEPVLAAASVETTGLSSNITSAPEGQTSSPGRMEEV